MTDAPLAIDTAATETAVRPAALLLQLALDVTDLDEARALAIATREHMDVVEAGTVLLAQHGLRAVEALRTELPDHTIVADLRVVRAGAALARLAFDAGVDWLSVMAVAPDETIAAAVEVADSSGGEVQAEFEHEVNATRAAQLATLGVTHGIVHRIAEPADLAVAPDGDAARVAAIKSSGMLATLAGGIRLDNVASLASMAPHVLVVGSAIAGADDPRAAAGRFRAIVNGMA